MRLAVTCCALLTFASVACYRGSHNPPAAPAAPQTRAAAVVRDPLAFLPGDTEVVIAADLGKLKRSALWRHVEPIVYGQAGEDLMRFRELCGYDPLSSLTRVTFALRSLDAPRATGVFVLRGIDRAQTMACLQKNLPAERRIKMYPSPAYGELALVSPGKSEDPVAFGFANDTTMVILVGPTASAAELTRLMDGGAPLRSSPAFLELFSKIESNRELWFVLNAKHAFARLAELGVQSHAFAGSISAAQGINATVRMRVANPDQAREVAEVMRAALHPLAQEVEYLEVVTESADVVGHIRMTDQQVAQLSVDTE